MTLTSVLLALPWLGLLIFEAVVARFPSELPGGPDRDPVGNDSPTGRSASTPDGVPTGDDALTGDVPAAPGAGIAPPLVSVVVPARNEAANIVACVRSLAESSYPDFEIIVVDDRSDDDTAVLASSVAPGNARRVVVVEGEELPPGWLGKPWACHQGSQQAQGEILLFTDADTVHGANLLARAVAGLREERADLLTVVGRQIMESFWERVVQPHVFFLMLLRFPDFERVARNDNWRDGIANGQFLLFTRAAYESIGGHASVRDEVVEDLALAQVVKRAGLRLRIRSAEGSLATRMYRSLGDLVEGWSKNMLMGGLQSVPREIRWLLPPVSFVGGLILWLLAPAVLAWGLLGGLSGAGPDAAWLWWSGLVYGVTVLMWMHWYGRMRAPRGYALLYPLAAAVFAYIFLRSWTQGRSVVWKGRRYELPAVSDRP